MLWDLKGGDRTNVNAGCRSSVIQAEDGRQHVLGKGERYFNSSERSSVIVNLRSDSFRLPLAIMVHWESGIYHNYIFTLRRELPGGNSELRCYLLAFTEGLGLNKKDKVCTFCHQALLLQCQFEQSSLVQRFLGVTMNLSNDGRVTGAFCLRKQLCSFLRPDSKNNWGKYITLICENPLDFCWEIFPKKPQSTIKKNGRIFEGLSHYLLFLFSFPVSQSSSSLTKYPSPHNISYLSSWM